MEWSWEAAQSSAYDGAILSDLEKGVRSYHDHLRPFWPELDGDREPEPGVLTRMTKEIISLEAGA